MSDGNRHLDWDGCFNVRDLGGLRTVGGGETRRGALVRADCSMAASPRAISDRCGRACSKP